MSDQSALEATPPVGIMPPQVLAEQENLFLLFIVHYFPYLMLERSVSIINLPMLLLYLW